MKIDSLKDLESVLKLCHKQGVHSITIDGITMQIGDLPEPKSAKEAPEAVKPEASYSDEDMLLWSSGV